MDNNSKTTATPTLKITIEGGPKTGKTTLALLLHDMITNANMRIGGDSPVTKLDDAELSSVDHPSWWMWRTLNDDELLARLSAVVNNGVQFEIVTVDVQKSV